MDASRAQNLVRLKEFTQQNAAAVWLDEAGGKLMDVAIGKELPLEAGELVEVRVQQNKETGKSYLQLRYGNGRQLALTEVGIGFAPLFESTGPLPELPPVVCWRDHQTLLARLKHDLYGHPDAAPTRDTAKLLLMCIAILEGAREVGFEVGREEQELEVQLRELEKRRPPPVG